MFENYKFTAAERFLRYVRVDTQSDPQSKSSPSTEKQKDLSRILAEELKQIGLNDAHMDEWGYVYATILLIQIRKFPSFVFLHMLIRLLIAAGTDVRPIVHKTTRA
jgi:tripeptide aminopeptidase